MARKSYWYKMALPPTRTSHWPERFRSKGNQYCPVRQLSLI